MGEVFDNLKEGLEEAIKWHRGKCDYCGSRSNKNKNIYLRGYTINEDHYVECQLVARKCEKCLEKGLNPIEK